MKWFGFVGGVVLALVGAAHANEVVIPGSFAVSESGAANYSIEIDVPPGTAGVEPKLSLSYSSQGGNGLLGVGWSLSGLSSITRCPKTIAQDGVRGAVKFDANDRFCLDGQRLLSTSGAYGASGTEYRTEMEGFSRIISTGVTGTGPTSFTVETKSGLTMTFGGTTDSRLQPSGSASVMTWSLNRVEDTVGNQMDVLYYDFPSQGANYPARIDYAGGSPTAPSAVVMFVYEVRADAPTSFHEGVQFSTLFRLQSVQTYISGTQIGQYNLAYDYSPSTFVSRVVSIERCDGAGTCLPKTEVSWLSENAGATQFDIVENVANQNGASYQNFKHYLADFNGDGRTDILWVFSHPDGRSSGIHTIWLTQDVGGGANQFDIVQNVAGQNGPSYEHFAPSLGDINGDGKADILWAHVHPDGRSSGTHTIWLTENVGGGANQFDIVQNVAGQNGPSYHYFKPFLADFNGDSKTDILWAYVHPDGRSAGTHTIWLTENVGGGANQFDIVQNVAGQNGPSYHYFKPFLADFNGDSKTDILWAYVHPDGRSSGTHTIWLTESVGGGANQFDIIQNVAGQNGPSYHYFTPSLGDFNGDGKADILWAYVHPDGRSSGTHTIWLTKGVGNGLNQFDITQDVAGQNGPSYHYFKPFLADFNGDSKTDILWAYVHPDGRSSGSHTIWLTENVGGGANQFDIVQNVAGQNGPSYHYFVPSLGDFDGNSLTDIFWAYVHPDHRSSGTHTIWLDVGKRNVLTSIDDGFGEKVRLTYKPLTDGSVYTKGTGATYPEVDLQVPSYVVTRAEVRDGIGGFVPTEYRYGGLKARADGRGSLGFAWTEAEQVETDFVTRREYRQDYPYVGRISLERTSAPSVGLAGVLSEKTYSFGCLNPANGLGCTEAAGNRYFPYATSIVEKGWDLDGSVLPVVTTTNAYDSWGNATQINVSTSDGFSKSTVNTYTNDAVNWILGRLTRTEVTDVTP